VPTILFISESCLLDRKSGAAQSARAQLKALARAGWQAHAATLTLFDGDMEYPRATAHSALSPLPPAGSTVQLDDEGVAHTLYVTHSSRQKAVRPWELQAFMALVQPLLDRLQPDVVLTYSSPLLQPLLAQAQQRGARTVFYVANSAYARPDVPAFRFVDAFVVPSKAMVTLYRDKLGTDAQVVRDLVQAPLEGRRNLAPERVAQRKAQRFVTMVNPDPAKGGQFFLNLVEQARVLAPGLRFRAVESRWGRAEWARHGMPTAVLDLVDWVPHTDNMGRVFEEAALLLVPSLWFEASGRVVAEALLAGVPVLAMKSGGLEEQLNGGGFLFDVPPALKADHLAAPEKKDLHQWVHFIRVLMDDDAMYTQAVKLALQAAALHEPARAQAAAVATYTAIAHKPLLPGLAHQPIMQAQLQAQRERMNAMREAVNAQLEQPAPGHAWVEDGKDTPYALLLKQSLAQPAIRGAMQAVKAKELDRARAVLEQYLRLMPEDITALGLLADVADQQEREVEARRLMERVVTLAPGFVQGQQQLLRYLRAAGDAEGALLHSFARLERAPNHPRYLALHAGLLVQANRFEDAIKVFEAFFRQQPGTVHDWMPYALALKTLGHQVRGVAAYRKAIELAPGVGAAWHALSNMKLAVFTADDVTIMEQQLARTDLSPEDRYNIHFTLGKAFEDEKAYAPSFDNYAHANRIRCSQSDYDVGRLEAYVAEAKETFTAAFFAARAGQGNPATDPVFVLGLHRAGSTLTEQILASHTKVEGTRELPDMLRIGRNFGGIGPRGSERGLNAALLADLGPAEWAALGQQYLDTTRGDRQTGRPMFIDKMPANWMYTGLIHLMLPNAKIIDIRRDPMAAGFALFKMNFGRGVDHSYDQRDIARYYRAYADLMAHFNAVLPGRVHHLRYESLVENTEAEIRRLLAYAGLPFEPGCLRYWETERAVQTPSSEQVRQPIYKGSVDVWTHYAEWLGPMREAFGELA
jgi:glycosyltransferase involved in cell wall biosynthesis/tetratricopeptide (TPR) repeat protein